MALLAFYFPAGHWKLHPVGMLFATDAFFSSYTRYGITQMCPLLYSLQTFVVPSPWNACSTISTCGSSHCLTIAIISMKSSPGPSCWIYFLCVHIPNILLPWQVLNNICVALHSFLSTLYIRYLILTTYDVIPSAVARLIHVAITGSLHPKFPVLLLAHNSVAFPCPCEVKFSHMTFFGQENRTDMSFLG